jgi:DNA (cytosine-5)-methyltransferase 1
MDIVFGLDLEPYASSTFQRNFPNARFIQSDIREVSKQRIAEEVGRNNRQPLLISACAPCQPYSTFVGHQPRDSRRSLLLQLLPVIEDLKPAFVFIENVPRLKRENTPAGTFARFCKALRRLGFSVTSGIVDCQNYGVPQRRRRLVILASRLGPVAIPDPTHGSGPSKNPISTVWEWIGHLPAIEAGVSHPSIPNHVSSKLTALNLKRIEAIEPGGTRAQWPSDLQLECHKFHGGHSDVYGRMRPDAPAPVLTTKCTSISNGRFGHPFQNRPISVREAACLQTFPESFVFDGGIKAASKQVGNAVPVLLAQKMGEVFVAQWAEHLRDAARSTVPQRAKSSAGM